MVGMRTPHREPAVPAPTTDERAALCSRCFSHTIGCPDAWGCPGERAAPMLGERIYFAAIMLLIGTMLTGLVWDFDHTVEASAPDVAAILTCAVDIVSQPLRPQQNDAGAGDTR